VPTGGNTPQVRIAGLLGRLVYVSSTGAIVRVGSALTSDRVWRLSINLESEPLEVSVRVVRSEAVPIRLANATWRHQEYALMLAFMDLPISAKEATQFESVPTGSDTPQVRIAGFLGRLVYFSSTGAIVQMGAALRSDRVWRLSINLESERLEMSVRVVRSEAVPVRLANATWRHQEYALMLAFMDLPISAKAALERLCSAGSGRNTGRPSTDRHPIGSLPAYPGPR